MNCKNCGNTLNSSDKFCSKCGTKVEVVNEFELPRLAANQQTSNTATVQPKPEILDISNSEVLDTKSLKSIEQPLEGNNINNAPKSKIKLFCIIAVIIVLVIGAIVGTIFIFNDKKDTDEENVEQVVKNTISYGKYIFEIPAGYEATPISNGLSMISNNDEIEMLINIMEGTNLKRFIQMKDSIKKQYETDGKEITDVYQKNYNNHDYLIFVSSYKNYPVYISYTDLKEDTIIGFNILNAGIKSDEDIYSTVASIIANIQVQNGGYVGLESQLNEKDILDSINKLELTYKINK